MFIIRYQSGPETSPLNTHPTSVSKENSWVCRVHSNVHCSVRSTQTWGSLSQLGLQGTVPASCKLIDVLRFYSIDRSQSVYRVQDVHEENLISISPPQSYVIPGQCNVVVCVSSEHWWSRYWRCLLRSSSVSADSSTRRYSAGPRKLLF